MTSLLMFYTLPVACLGALCRFTGERVLAFVLYFLVTFFLVVTKFGFMGTLLLGGAAMLASMFATNPGVSPAPGRYGDGRLRGRRGHAAFAPGRGALAQPVGLRGLVVFRHALRALGPGRISRR